MTITPFTTRPITTSDKSLTKILDEYLHSFADGSILAITSKIVALIEGRVKEGDTDLASIIAQEAHHYVPSHSSKYNVSLTIKDNTLVANAGIDQSNGNGHYILWPNNAQNTANEVRAYLKKRFSLKACGVIITDSVTTPLRWGTIGTSIAHSGFAALNDYRGKPDIFGKKLEITQSNVADGLAAAAVVVMGEGQEQTPIAVINDVPHIAFQDRNPTKNELDALKIDPKDDLYAPLLEAVKWKKGKK